LLFRIKPGHQAGSTARVADPLNDGSRDTEIEVWSDWDSLNKVRSTAYTKIWSKKDYVWEYGGAITSAYPDEGCAEGFNGFLWNAFMNGVDSTQGWYQRLDQIILSKNPIPCPQA
jgi:hypothetical protein